MVIAVEQMKYVSILGPLDMFDEFVLKNIINRNVQLESSYKSLNVPGLIPFEEDTSLDNLRKLMRILNEKFDIKIKNYDRETIENEFAESVDLKSIKAFAREIEDNLIDYRKQTELYKADIQEREQILKQIIPLAGLEINIDELFHLSFMKFRFGFLSKESYRKQKSYLEELDVVVAPVSEDSENIWLSYFMPSTVAPVIDNVFAAIGFERVRISGDVKGMPKLTIEKIKEEIIVLKNKISEAEAVAAQFLKDRKDRFDNYYHKILYLSKINEIKKLSAHTKETFFLAGWIPNSDYQSFCKEVEPMERITFSSEDPENVISSIPPTIMKNNRFFKPFESLVTMYGLPSAREMDPTPLTAITYVLMFGFMFGDVGQGAIIALVGLFLYKRKKMDLGGVMLYVGISSMIFGFVYGSVFGNEELISPLWLSPLHGKNTINTLLYGAVGYGACIIIVTMIANMINNIRLRKWGKLLFDKNGLAGLLFYGGLAVILFISLKTGKVAMTGLTVVIVIIIPALMIFFKEPLENLMLRKDHIFPKEKGMYFIEAAFDIFETVLSFFSGTVSFARVGAFALNHAGLSLAVWTLYNMMDGVGGVIIVIIGNLITIGLEGLIVAIQCMRLEYYEMFGRFYIGEGQEFKPVMVTEE